jgi:hypothetical protein
VAAGGNLSIGGTDLYLRGRGGGAGNNGGAARALVDGGAAEGLVLNYANDFGKVTINGGLYVPNLPFGDLRNVQWDSVTGQFYYDNSSRRHKENITPLKEDFLALLKAEPQSYTRPGAPDRWEIGYIAEEFDALGLKKLVDYAPDGRTPEGINYEKICLYLTEVAKHQQKQVESLQKDNAEKTRRLAEVEARLERLERLAAEGK